MRSAALVLPRAPPAATVNQSLPQVSKLNSKVLAAPIYIMVIFDLGLSLRNTKTGESYFLWKSLPKGEEVPRDQLAKSAAVGVSQVLTLFLGIEMISIGIDPGWSSFGLAVWDTDKKKVLIQESLIPKEEGNLFKFQLALDSIFRIDTWLRPEGRVFIERFVPYAGCPSAAAEMTNIVIGYLIAYFGELIGRGSYNKSINLMRAIDWKPAVCKHLVKNKGFSNPSATFDKKFSLAAAEAICGGKVVNDHVADAICLSYLGEITK